LVFSSVFSVGLNVQPAQASEVPVESQVVIKIHYNFDGIAGPSGEGPDFWDDFVYPAFLINEDRAIKYATYTKVNYVEGDNIINSERIDHVATARFFDVADGAYSACIPLSAPATVDEFFCTVQFQHTAGSVEEPIDLRLNANETFELLTAARALDVNGKPCSGTQIGWILCPLAEEVFDSLKTVFTDVFHGILRIDPLTESNDEGSATAALFNIWNSFRMIANVLFVIVFMVAIFGQGLGGFQVFSAYDFRKIMPRLVIGVIGIQLSWYAAGFLVDVFNVLGAGARGLILAPVNNFELTEFDVTKIGDNIALLSVTSGLITWGFSSVGGFLGMIFLLPILFVNIFLAMIFGVLILLLRNSFILLGIVISPIAFVSWILPNTQGIFLFWWNSMWRLLIMYPLIIALIGLGELAAKVVVAGHEGSMLWSIVGMVVLFTPFFLIPYTFRVAQNVLGSVTTGLDGRRQLITDRMFGSPEDEFSYRGRAAHRRQRYRTMKRWDRSAKHFVQPHGRDFLRPWKQKGGLRTSWRKGYRTSIGQGERREPSRFGQKGDRSQESWGSYLASLPRYALRTPGRLRATLSNLGAAAIGEPGVDELMGIRNREARDRYTRMAEFIGGDDYAHALFGDYNLFTGKKLSAAVINAAKPHRKDDAQVQEAMKILVAKTAANPYRHGLLMDHWYGRRNKKLPTDAPLYDAGRLEYHRKGMLKGVAFGTQGVHRDTKARDFETSTRSIRRSERPDERADSEVPMADLRRYDELQAGMGLVKDTAIPDALGEETFNISTDKQVSFSGTDYQKNMEIVQRFLDISLVEPMADGGGVNVDSLTAKTDSDDRDWETLDKLRQPRVKDEKTGEVRLREDGVNYDKTYDKREEALTDAAIQESFENSALLLASRLDVLVQHHSPLELGDEDDGDQLRETTPERVYAGWRRTNRAEYMWSQELGRDPTAQETRDWKDGKVPSGVKAEDRHLYSRDVYMQERENEITESQLARITEMLANPPTGRIAPGTIPYLRDYVNDAKLLLQRDKLEERNTTGLVGDIDSIIEIFT